MNTVATLPITGHIAVIRHTLEAEKHMCNAVFRNKGEIRMKKVREIDLALESLKAIEDSVKAGKP